MLLKEAKKYVIATRGKVGLSRYRLSESTESIESNLMNQRKTYH